MAVALDWGNVPTWIGSVGTVGALLFGVVTLRHELSERRAAREHARRSQAHLITAWTDEVTDGINEPSEYRTPERPDRRVVTIANRSDRAIYDVAWTLWDRETACRMDTGYVRALGPHAQETVPITGPFGGDPEVHLAFLDADGVQWMRTDRLMSTDEWLEHPENEKWQDPRREWTLVWPPDVVQALRELLTEHSGHREGDPMVIALIWWRIKPNDDAVEAFEGWWLRDAVINDRSRLFGEFMSKPILASTLPYPSDDLSAPGGDYFPFVNVGVWRDIAAFNSEVGAHIDPDRQPYPFEAQLPSRTLLCQQVVRAGEWRPPWV